MELPAFLNVLFSRGKDNLRSSDNHKAVANRPNSNQEIRKRHPELEPPDCPLVIVIAIKEYRILCKALKSQKKIIMLLFLIMHIISKCINSN